MEQKETVISLGSLQARFNQIGVQTGAKRHPDRPIPSLWFRYRCHLANAARWIAMTPRITDKDVQLLWYQYLDHRSATLRQEE